ncbi:hypothetical protein [Luteimonas salinilitoris]
MIYLPGLSGPLIFDDYWNLAPLTRWQNGDQGWQPTLLPNPESFIFSRPVAMASFMLTTWLGGTGAFALKLGNLVIHLCCGLIGALLLRRLMQLDSKIAPYANLAAALAAVVWLVHPLQVSTVLYAVQRMAQLATLFSLAATLLYVVGRQQIEKGLVRQGILSLFVAFPLLFALGLLSKQNAAVTPLICLALEFAYFQKRSRSSIINIFFLLFALLPIAGIAVLLISFPGRLLAEYSNWDFSLLQRIITQPRVLLDYIGMWLLPRSSAMGLYTDDYIVSTNFFTPMSTIGAVIALVAISLLTIFQRRQMPTLFAGWFFFLAAHSVEASFLPLEMYYEHRNYLPAFGLLLMACSVVRRLTSTPLIRLSIRPRLLWLSVFLLIGALALSTYARVLVWQDEYAMTEQGIRHHPDSIRVRLDRVALSLRTKNYADALATLEPMLTHPDSRQRLIGRIDRLVVRCISGASVDTNELDIALKDATPLITVHEIHLAILQEAVTRNGECSQIPPDVFARSLAMLADAATSHPEATQNKSTMRRIASQLYARGGRWDLAEEQAEIGWRANPTMPLGLVLARAYAINGKHSLAIDVLARLDEMPRIYDDHWRREIRLAREFVEDQSASDGLDHKR